MEFLQNDENIRIGEDGFIWKIINPELAKKLFLSDLVDLYSLYPDDSDSLITSFSELVKAIDNDLRIGLEVGKLNIQQIPDLTDLFEPKKVFDIHKTAIIPYIIAEKVTNNKTHQNFLIEKVEHIYNVNKTWREQLNTSKDQREFLKMFMEHWNKKLINNEV